MNINQSEKMKVLLHQIQLPHNVVKQYFDESKLLKLHVYKQKKRWNFEIQIRNLLPFNVYQLFLQHLRNAFQSIAEIDVRMVTENISNEEQYLPDYFQEFVRKQKELLPVHKELLLNQRITIEGRYIVLRARNEAEANSIKNKLDEPFRKYCTQIGVSNYALRMIIEQNEEDYENFQVTKAMEDKELALKTFQEQKKRKENHNVSKNQLFQIGAAIQTDPIPIEEIIEEERDVTIQGYVFDVEVRKLRSGRSLLILKVTDYTDSIEVKMFSNHEEDEVKFNALKDGFWLLARGRVQTDNYTNELTMMAQQLKEIKVAEKEDHAEQKRIELHAHTTMSQLDAVASPTELIERAAKWGHEAIAITDHSVVQGYPEAFFASMNHPIKVIYGMEANLVDDGIPIAYNEKNLSLKDATYVVFDVETTGLSAVYDTIIELAAVKIHKGEIIDRFESFANPNRPLPQKIIEITQITDEMLKDAPSVEKVLEDFYQWIGDDVLVAHNASFDIGFLNNGFQKIGRVKVTNPVIDTLELARFLLPNLGNHRLNTLCAYFNIDLTQHHRAIYDAEATGFLFWRLLQMVFEKGILSHDSLNDLLGDGLSYQHSRPFHCTLLAINQTGLKNLYKLVSDAHIEYFYRVPRIPRSLLQKHREGLFVGSGCKDGELFETVMQSSIDEAEKVAEFYDYLEVQPPETYYPLIEREILQNEAQLLEIIKKIVDLGKRLNKPVVATGNVHHLDPEDQIYRKILVASQKGNPLNRQRMPDTSFLTTEEMLRRFSFLGEETAKEIVVTNPHQINEQIEDVHPLQEGLFTPRIEGAEEEVRSLTYKNAKTIYGDPLPEIVEKRLEKELNSIIGHGFAVIYLISHKLVKKSLQDGYLVGSRGSVGSSLVATMMEITEVNPLPPHYVCKTCHTSEFITDGSYASGYDLPDKNCPNCDIPFEKDGQDIPFETFLGFEGDKVPDIDLNFSGEYQPTAHQYTKELFGEDKVYRAGTIGTIAERTAFGFVKGYAQDQNITYRKAEIDRLVKGCTGVKRTTGQHPGGIIVVPQDKDIYDFTPIQYPADDRTSEWKTTHFDFHSIENNLLKLDILGHDDPTVIRMLQDLSGIDPKDVPIDDEKVMQIFSSTEPLGVTPKQIMCQTGTLGIPEFGTQFVRQMLEETKPKTFAELVIISGLSHGTDVWLGNAQELINQGICELSEVIGCRDDIMVYLMHQGLEASLAFKIMESVRRGRGLQQEWIEEMKKHGVPDWYIDSCQKIKYMFPKAHAAAYVLMAVRISYFKVYYPLYFYAAYFTVRARDFEIETMLQGKEAVRDRIQEILAKGNEASPKERTLLTVLHVTLEMYERGYSFQPIDLYKSAATEFIVEGDTLIPPFHAIDSLGINAARNIVKVREEGEFLSKQDLRERGKISKTVVESLERLGCLDGLPEENQLSLFD